MRISQNTVNLKSLLEDAQKGRLFPAAFQRPYVWSKCDVLALLHSIKMEYPLGSMVAWTPPSSVDLSKAGTTRLGPVPQAPENRSILILDGQNRLATLAWVALDGTVPDLAYTPHERDVWLDGERLVFSMATGEFLFVPEAQANDGFTLPAHSAFDSRVGLHLSRKRWTAEWANLSDEEKDEGLRRYDSLTNAFSNARLVLTHLERGTVAEAQNAFLHICRTGVPMSQADFDRAVAWVDL